MPGPFSPSDSLVGPIASEIATLVAAQIPSVGTIYVKLPDRPPADNTVIIPMTRCKVLSDTNGKMKLQLTYSIRHLFRRANMADTLTRAYSYVMPWMNFLAAWPNQSLGGLALSVTATEMTMVQLSESGQPMVGLVVNVNVLTEFNIPLT